MAVSWLENNLQTEYLKIQFFNAMGRDTFH